MLAERAVVAYRGNVVGEDGKTLADRLNERMQGRNKALVARSAGISRTQLLSILDGTTKHPRIETLDAIAAVLGTSRDWLLYGTESDEEDISTMEQLHAWEMKVARQRERYMRRILERQQAEMGATQTRSLEAVLARMDEHTARQVRESLASALIQDARALGPHPNAPAPQERPSDPIQDPPELDYRAS